MLKALRHPPLARLWFGQALSSIGDEIYRVGLTWLAVGLIGADTGYLTAGQFASLMILSFVGGKWADHWEPVSTMITVDLARAAVVFIPVIVSFFTPVPLSLLVIVALVVSALSAFFDPALQAILPKFSPNTQTLRAATGLMSTTIRMARMIGPAIIGVLSGLVPPIHFFTVNAITFLFSAAYVKSLKKFENEATGEVRVRRRSTFKEAILSGFHLVRAKEGMTFVLLSKAGTGGVWNLAFVLGYALLVQQIAPGDASSFGFLVASYGAGNLVGALYFGNRERGNTLFAMYSGHLWLGLGFALVAIAPTLKWMIPVAAFTGFFGPMNELNFLDIIQTHYQPSEITKIFRLRLALETGSALVLMLVSPFLFRALEPRGVIAICGVVTMATGLAGLLWYAKDQRAKT